MDSGKLMFSRVMDLLPWDSHSTAAAFTLDAPAVAAAVQIAKRL